MLTTTINKVLHEGNGAATEFSFSFPILTEETLKLYLVDADELTTEITSNYSVTGIGDAEGGVVTYPVSGTPINSDTKLLIYREMDMTQQTNFSNQGGFFPKIHETAFDSTMMVIQQVQEQLDRSVMVPLGSEVDPEDLIDSLSEAAVQAQDARDGAQESATAASESAAGAAASATASESFASDAQAARDAIPAADDILDVSDIGDRVEAHDPDIIKADTPDLLQTVYGDEAQVHTGTDLSTLTVNRNHVCWTLTADSTFSDVTLPYDGTYVFHIYPSSYSLPIATSYKNSDNTASPDSSAGEIRIVIEQFNSRKTIVSLMNVTA